MIREALAKLTSRVRSARNAAPVKALYEQGVAAFRAGEYARAGQSAEQAAALDPALASIHFLLGNARFELREFEAAEAAFTTCLALQPEYPLILHATVGRAQARARAAAESGRMPQVIATPDFSPHISIIICSIRPERFARVCETYRALFRDVRHEIIGIHDARSLCEGYNRGAARARGEIVLFSHDDVEIATPDFAARLLRHLARHDVVGVAGTTRLIGGSWTYAGWPHLQGQVGSRISRPGSLMVTIYGLHGGEAVGVQAIDGVFLAAHRPVLERVRFDEQTFDGWHLYDLDFTFCAHLAGFRTAVCQDLCLIHNSFGTYDRAWETYIQRFEDKHRGRLQRGEPQAQKRCTIEVASPADWRLLTEELIAHG